MPFLLEDIHSHFNPKIIYGRRRDEVTIVSEDYDSVAIVADCFDNRFPCPKKLLSETQPIEIIINPPVPMAAQPPKAKSAPPFVKQQKTLFENG